MHEMKKTGSYEEEERGGEGRGRGKGRMRQGKVKEKQIELNERNNKADFPDSTNKY